MWESLLKVQPLMNIECLCACLKYTCYKHRLLFNKSVSQIPIYIILVFEAWSVSQGLPGIADWHSYTQPLSGRHSSDEGEGFFGGWIKSAHKTTICIEAKELICQHQAPDWHLLQGSLELLGRRSLFQLYKVKAVLGRDADAWLPWEVTASVALAVEHFGRKQPG